jgi:PAS domain S-box-containing protein
MVTGKNLDYASADTNGLLARFAENVGQIIYCASISAEPHFKMINNAVKKVTGYSSQEILEGNINWLELVHERDRDKLIDSYQTCLKQGRPVIAEYRIITKDNQLKDIIDSFYPVFDDKGQVVAVDGVMFENSQRKSTQRELERTQMLQSLGRLTAGVAHEINTPIQFVGDNTRFLLDAFGQISVILKMYKDLADSVNAGKPDNVLKEKINQAQCEADLDFLMDEVPKAINQSNEGIKRVTAIVSAMRDFSHIDERRQSSVDINKVINSSLVICRNEFKYVADLETDLDENLPRVICCLDDMNQVFLNLIINAAHSIADVIGNHPEKRGLLRITTKRSEDDVVITVSDTGTGISQEVANKMFEPFFTTKPAGQGTGQGLSIVKSKVIDKHGGKVDFKTESGKGTTFIITLPINGKPKVADYREKNKKFKCNDSK